MGLVTQINADDDAEILTNELEIIICIISCCCYVDIEGVFSLEAS
jgi:hypothetical protein